MCEIGQAKSLFDAGNLLLRIVKTVFAEHSVFDLFELVAEFVKLLVGEVLFPCGKYDRVFARGVVLVHAYHRFEGSRERFGIAAGNPRLTGDGKHERGDLAPTLMLRHENIRILRRSALHLFYDRKDMLLFQHLLVVVLAKSSEKGSGFMQRGGIELGGVLAQPRHNFVIDQQRSAQDPVFAHEVLGRCDLRLGILFLSVLCLKRNEGAGY